MRYSLSFHISYLNTGPPDQHATNSIATALSLPRHLPAFPIVSRWHSEPLRLLSLTAHSFLRNPKGYPVLSRAHQTLISMYMRIRNPPWILLCDVGPIPGLDNPDDRIPVADGFLSPSATADAAQSPTLAEASRHQQQSGNKKIKDPMPHLSYIRNLQRKQPSRTTLDRLGAGYQDYLQAPLQPLTDNLESITYEVFEKDPIKYDWYERAIARALRDWAEQGKPTSSPDGRVVVAVVGAGRGPLVTRALRASEAVSVEIELWAVEKNPNAYVLLQRHNEEDWRNRVTVVKSDMRAWKGPWRDGVTPTAPSLRSYTSSADAPSPYIPQPEHTPIDILVSELLGSFADNELSPECLDGITHLLNPDYGISIPASYSAHLTPIAAPKLHADIAARGHSDASASETPYVVMLHAIDYLSTNLSGPTPPRKDPGDGANNADFPLNTHAPSTVTPPTTTMPNVHKAWEFSHAPSLSPPEFPICNRHNERHARLTFRTRDRGVCHGLAGYFETVLYPGVELSTNPVTMEHKSPGMISWFPIFFPLKVRLNQAFCLRTFPFTSFAFLPSQGFSRILVSAD